MRQGRSALFYGRHFGDDIIVLCVRWYLRYPLSYRDLEEMMAERGLTVDHSTIARWVLHMRRFWRNASGGRCAVRTDRGGSMKRTFGWQGNGLICIGLWGLPVARVPFCCRRNASELLPKAFSSLRSLVTRC